MSNDPISLLSELVKIPSVCGEEQGVANFIAKWLRDRGLPVEVKEVKPGRPNVISQLRANARGPSFMLNGHMDTVAPGAGWTHDPYGAEVEGGRMYGRGTVDMKSGLAAILSALADCREEGLPKKGRIIVAAVVDEESIDLGTCDLVNTGLTDGLDFGVVSEATELSVVTGHRGRAVFEILVRGRPAHSMWPERGVSAIANAATIINALNKLPSHNHSRMGRSTVNVLKVEGGQEEVMLVPDRCRLLIDRCLVPGHGSKDALLELKTLLKQLGIDAESRLIERETPFCESFEIPETHEAVRWVVEAAAKVLGTVPSLTYHDGPCDSCILVNQGNVPTVEFGPSGGGLHQADEFVDVESVTATTEVYKQLIRTLVS